MLGVLRKKERTKLLTLAASLDPIHCFWDKEKEKGSLDCPFFSKYSVGTDFKLCCWYCAQVLECCGGMEKREAGLRKKKCQNDPRKGRVWCGLVNRKVREMRRRGLH